MKAAYKKAVAAWRPTDRSSPRPKCDNWIYADYSKVKEWAKNEPTEFIGTITPK